MFSPSNLFSGCLLPMPLDHGQHSGMPAQLALGRRKITCASQHDVLGRQLGSCDAYRTTLARLSRLCCRGRRYPTTKCHRLLSRCHGILPVNLPTSTSCSPTCILPRYKNHYSTLLAHPQTNSHQTLNHTLCVFVNPSHHLVITCGQHGCHCDAHSCRDPSGFRHPHAFGATTNHASGRHPATRCHGS